MWTLRLLFEFMSHNQSCFVTLTYNNDNLPYNIYGEPQLCKLDVQLFMKRLRKMFTGTEIRYYCVGEYGERTKRPHYHLIIFGIDFNLLGLDNHFSSSILCKLWSYGNNMVGTTTVNSIQYVAGYVLKKFVNKKMDTITPEFTLMSRRPGIGFYAYESYINLYNNNSAFRHYFDTQHKLPSTISFNGRTYPLDRYFKWKLYDSLDVSERQVFLDFAFKTLKRQGEAIRSGYNNLFEFEIDVDKQARLNQKSKITIYNKRRDLYEEEE